jgi:hypothetical protein
LLASGRVITFQSSARSYQLMRLILNDRREGDVAEITAVKESVGASSFLRATSRNFFSSSRVQESQPHLITNFQACTSAHKYSSLFVERQPHPQLFPQLFGTALQGFVFGSRRMVEKPYAVSHLSNQSNASACIFLSNL